MKIIDIVTEFAPVIDSHAYYIVDAGAEFDPVDFAETAFPDFDRPAMIKEETIERVRRVCAGAKDGFIRLIPIDGGDLT